MTYEKGQKIIEGKTKIVWEIKGDSQNVIIENKNDITAFDDPSFTKQFQSKAEYATTVTCRVFELLKKAGIPVAYNEQYSTNEFSVPKCTMIPLEVVERRFAVGSYLKRHPEFVQAENSLPHRFHKLIVEFFLKTTKGGLNNAKGENILQGLDPLKGEEDPYITNPLDSDWKLYHSKKPSWVEEADIQKTVKANNVFPEYSPEMIKKIEEISRKTFLTLEGAWNTLGFRLIDMKIEFGIDLEGNLVVADVIDNDSWRLRDMDWKELSKEAFRQGEALDEVEKKYGYVASLVQNFRIPKQALVLWRGSDGDTWLDLNILKDINGLSIEEITLSGHKSTQLCLHKLDEIIGCFPDSGVIITKVGRSNGLGPIVAARTIWPVITIPATIDTFPEDLWSSVRMPSNVPLATVWPEANAILLAAEILAQKNPLIYQRRQFIIEGQDE